MAEQQYQQYKDEGFITIILMVDASVGGSAEPVEGYASYYGMTMPVLNDPETTASKTIGMGWDIPYYVLLGRDLTHIYGGGSPAQDSAIEEALAEEWPEVDWPTNPVQEEVADLDVDLDSEVPSTGSTPFSMAGGPGHGEVVICSVGDRGAAAPWALLALAALFGLRRRA